MLALPSGRRPYRDRDVVAAANLGAVWALHFDHDRHGVARLDALGNEDVDLVEAHAGGLEDGAKNLRFLTANENPDGLAGQGDNTRRAQRRRFDSRWADSRCEPWPHRAGWMCGSSSGGGPVCWGSCLVRANVTPLDVK